MKTAFLSGAESRRRRNASGCIASVSGSVVGLLEADR
jgi:hypothetical protein